MSDVSADLYDAEVIEAGKIMKDLVQRFRYKATTQHNLEELTKYATEAFFNIGLIAVVDVSPVLLGQSPLVEIQGRVPGSSRSYTEDGYEFMDHERKSVEVKKSRDLGESYHGEKEKNTV